MTDTRDWTQEHDCNCAPGANGDMCSKLHAWDCRTCDGMGWNSEVLGCGCCVVQADCTDCNGTGVAPEWQPTAEALADLSPAERAFGGRR